ncbi:alpha/beta-hydrolase [Neolentinus lepideus HHB14362 ss-1]|uniref:Alpha/beta-hydrolase n=1 Tax=Neolentinus lepideus HHB14362 ss-1 TaxID=1314782 RepID=A0A165UTN3_9AGAM|nr:alpha/beta-hydrolase [Neolentinus lepideus HHB14362 ss-1]
MAYFTFKSQPLKAFYLLYTALSVLFVHLPYWIIEASIPALRPRRSWPMSRAIMVHILRTFQDFVYATGFPSIPPVTASPQNTSEADRQLGKVWIDGVPEDMIRGEVLEAAKINGVRAEPVSGFWYGKRGLRDEVGMHAKASEKVLYYLHGGGYTTGSASPKDMWPSIINGIVDSSSGLLTRSFALDYRLSRAPPFGTVSPFPAALLDALAGYRYLVESVGFAPENIIVGGDSAGGHLAVILVRYLVVMHLPALVPPAGCILLCPTADWACTHDAEPSSSMERNYRSDYVYPILKSGYTGRALLGALPQNQLSTSVWLSPASLQIKQDGVFIDFPPSIIICGGAEHTLDPMRTLRDRLVADNGQAKVVFLEYPEAIHDFLLFPWHEPERSQALSEIKSWMQQLSTTAQAMF